MLLLSQSIAQQISFPKEISQPCSGDYVGVSFADSPKELSVLNAVLSYILLHEVTCNHVDDTSVIAIGDSIHTERTASFTSIDTVNQCEFDVNDIVVRLPYDCVPSLQMSEDSNSLLLKYPYKRE